jgi:hypothetical protein
MVKFLLFTQDDYNKYTIYKTALNENLNNVLEAKRGYFSIEKKK